MQLIFSQWFPSNVPTPSARKVALTARSILKGKAIPFGNISTTRSMAATFLPTSLQQRPCAKWRLRSFIFSIGWVCPSHVRAKDCLIFVASAAPNTIVPPSPAPQQDNSCFMRSTSKCGGMRFPARSESLSTGKCCRWCLTITRCVADSLP